MCCAVNFCRFRKPFGKIPEKFSKIMQLPTVNKPPLITRTNGLFNKWRFFICRYVGINPPLKKAGIYKNHMIKSRPFNSFFSNDNGYAASTSIIILSSVPVKVLPIDTNSALSVLLS